MILMDIWDDFEISLEVDDILRGEGADPLSIRSRRPALVKAAVTALDVGIKYLHPKAITEVVDVVKHVHERVILVGGGELTGTAVARCLSGAEQVILAICTIGPDLERYAHSELEVNPALGLALDGLGNAAVELLARMVCNRFGEQAQVEGKMISSPLSPGDPEWPVEIGQPQLFSKIDADRIDVKLTSGGMMVPKKTISFIAGIGIEMTQLDACSGCSFFEKCVYRHAG